MDIPEYVWPLIGFCAAIPTLIISKYRYGVTYSKFGLCTRLLECTLYGPLTFFVAITWLTENEVGTTILGPR